MLKYIELNRKELNYMIIKINVEEIEKLEIVRELEIEQLEEIFKKELKELEIEKSDELERLSQTLRFRILKKDFGEDQTISRKK